MRKMILGVMPFISALSTFAIDEKEQEYPEPPQQESLELGDNSQQRSWWGLPESIKGGTVSTLELIQSYLRNSKEAMDFEEVTFEKIPEDGPRKGTLYLQEVDSQLKCTGFITICENRVEKSYPISVFLFPPEGLTAESLKSIHLDHSKQIQSLFKHALGTLQEEALREHIDKKEVLSAIHSIQESPGTGGWWLLPSLLTPSSWLSNPTDITDTKDSEVTSEEGEPEKDARERKKEPEKSEILPGEALPTPSSLPDFPSASMPVDEIPFATSASNTDPLVTTEPPKGVWGGIGGYLGYLNLGGYLGEKKEEVMIALKEREDVTEDDLKDWRLIERKKKEEEKYKTFLMSDLPGNGIPSEGQIYVGKLFDKLQVKFTNFDEPMFAFPKNGEALEERKRYVGTKEPLNKPQILSVPSNPNLQVITAILNINLHGQSLTIDSLNSIKPQIIGMLELENFIPKEMDEIAVVDNEKEEEKGEEKERTENQPTESYSSDEGDSFL
jgi:hypothetical protein